MQGGKVEAGTWSIVLSLLAHLYKQQGLAHVHSVSPLASCGHSPLCKLSTDTSRTCTCTRVPCVREVEICIIFTMISPARTTRQWTDSDRRGLQLYNDE